MSSIKPVQKSLREQPTPVPVDSMAVAMTSNGTPCVAAPPGPAPEPRIAENYTENGREYHGFRRGKYMFPCDEMDRMDIFHKFFSVARCDVLHSAPLSSPVEELRILDVGTGTGIWAIDM
ncbi:hypothetical protein BJ875DRAFT_478860 [Amylocarpus encephaloides]|uniref:Methyltransferase n=1 Tax=Amylocarpus encephaloides TaxID=45428 RepID=A0A9P8BZB9_9HELO|nr:hypothetical protein BJ875DRAFT_478860 [Amylocarpus encephaloides]